MNSLRMKIVGFNDLSSTLQIKFCSDLAEKPIDDYPIHEFNVVELHDQVKTEEILKALAENGWNIAMQQEIAEQTAKNNKKVAEYKALIGQESIYTADELFYSVCPSTNQPLSSGLQEI